MKKKRMKWLAAALVLTLGIPLWNVAHSQTITVGLPQTEGRTFDGWGTSLCWWANRIGYSDALADLAAQAYFGKDGLMLNILRYNIGGGDDPTHHHIKRTDSAVPGWLVWNEEQQAHVYDYTADANQLHVLKKAVETIGEEALVEVFSNSPPYFMTNSGCSTGAMNMRKDNLREDCYDAFADYLVHVTDYIQHELGIEVASLSPVNEPDTPYWGAFSNKQEGCHYDPESQSKVIEAVAKALAKSRSTNVIIAAADETDPQRLLNERKAYSQEALSAIGRINVHTYSTAGIEELGQYARQNDLYLWMSEVDGADVIGENAGEMGPALWFGRKIITDLNALTPSAWVMWQVIDNHISAEGYNGNRDNGMPNIQRGFWGLSVADHDQQTILLTQKYYAMGQFSRYIRPGSRIITCTDEAIAAWHPETKELAIVALNTASAAQTVRFDLSAYANVSEAAQPYRTSGSMEDGEHWTALEAIALEGRIFEAQLKGNSITTFVIQNATLP